MATKTKVTQVSDRRSHYASTSPEASAGKNTVSDESGQDQIVEEVPGIIESNGSGAVETMESESEFIATQKHRPVSSPAPRTVRRVWPMESAAETDPKVDASFGNLSSIHDEHEFWGAVTRAIAPLVLTAVKRTGISLVKTGVKKVSPALSKMLRLHGFNERAIQRLESGSQESGAQVSNPEQQEFWGSIASALVPVLTPYAKRLAGAAVKKGSSWVRRIFESSQQESAVETEALAQQLEGLFLQQAAWSQQETGYISSEDQREFWGSLARKLAPMLAPVARAVAGAAVSAGKAAVTTGIKKLSPTLANMLRLEGFSEADLERLETAEQENSAEPSTSDQQEFWGAIAGALVPVLMPHAKKLAGAAVKTGSSWIKRIFETSEQEAGAEMESMALQLESLFVQLAPTETESVSITPDEQREFWGAIARKIVPVLSPIVKAAAGKAVNAGTSWIRRLFESSQHEATAETEVMSQQLEHVFLQEAALIQLESGMNVSIADQQEFWGAVARKLMPVLSPIAKALAGAAVSTGKSVIAGGIKKINPAILNLLRMNGVSESDIEDLEAGQEESGSNGSATDEREFWRSIVRTLVPVLKPFAQKIGRPAVSAAGRLVLSGFKFESGHIESVDNGAVATEASLQQFEALEVIIGRDDRNQVTTTTVAPYNRICHLSIKAADGSSFLGTGFFIGPRTIATAGHCVYQRDHGGWPQQIVVSPGRNGFNKPFGQFVATQFSSVRGWTESLDRDCDYGVIHLSRNDNVPPRIGFFGFGIFSDEAISSKQLKVSGYPGDKPSGTMMEHMRKATAINPTTIVYDIDTVGGQSGSPVYDEHCRAVAIHTNGATSGNSGTRITPSVFNNLNHWRMAGAVS